MDKISLLIMIAIPLLIEGCLHARCRARIRKQEPISSDSIEIKRDKILDFCITKFMVIISLTVLVYSLFIASKLFIGHYRFVSMNSMKPTMINGDKVFIDRASLFFSKPKRGDIMIFPAPYAKFQKSSFNEFGKAAGLYGNYHVVLKRVIGLPGEKIIIEPDEKGRSTVYINGKKLNENYILTNPRNPLARIHYGPYDVPKNSYFMLGDNREASTDSRDWGGLFYRDAEKFIKRDEFVGKVVLIFYPFNRFRWL